MHDTAGGVRIVMERRRDDEAAIASADAAEIYGGTIVASGVEDHAQNFTRFLLLADDERAQATAMRNSERKWKTSIMFRVANRPGSLFRALGAFDLTKIESRPVEGRPWEYAFYADLAGKRDDAAVTRALDALGGMAEMLRVFGSYPTRWLAS